MARGRPRKYKTKKEAAQAAVLSTARSRHRRRIHQIAQKELVSKVERIIPWFTDEYEMDRVKPLRTNVVPESVVHCAPWCRHSSVRLSPWDESKWDSLQAEMRRFRMAILECVEDMKYFGKQLQNSAKRFCSRNIRWSDAHKCGALFGHAVMHMECNGFFPDGIKSPPNWTYGTDESACAILSSLNDLAPERSQIMDCVTSWLESLLKEFREREGPLYGFQRGKAVLSELQREQEKVLRLLDDLKEKVKGDWIDCDSDSDSERVSETDLEDDDDPDRALFSKQIRERFGRHKWNWDDRFVSDEKDFRDFWIDPQVEIKDSYFISIR